MTTDEALARLRPLEGELRAGGLSALYLFGSTARGDARPDSDIDLAFDVDRAGFNVLHIALLKQRLEHELAVPVDLVSRVAITRRVDRIAHDLRRVF